MMSELFAKIHRSFW